MESLHVRAPDGLRRDVDKELERQWFLVVQLVHVGRRYFVWRASAQVLADSTMQLSIVAIEVETLIAGWRCRTKHRRQRDIGHGWKWRKKSSRITEVIKKATFFGA